MGNAIGVTIVILFMLYCLVGVGFMIADKEFKDETKDD